MTTLSSVVNDLKQCFGLKTCHLVFDRGMVSGDHLDLLEAQEITYLSAMDKDEMACHPLFQEFVPKPASKEDFEQTLALHEFVPTDDHQFFYTREGQVGKRRSSSHLTFNDTTIPQTEIIQRYREKNKIEEAFREMKSQLALSPIHLTRPERVKAHVTVCILAYLLVNTMEMMFKMAGHSISPIDVLKQVQSCQLNQVGIKGSPGYSLTVTEMTKEQIDGQNSSTVKTC
ncbi:MAG: transposase [Carboxydocellales bacterium]